MRQDPLATISPWEAEYVVLFCASEEAVLEDVLAQIGRFVPVSVGPKRLCQNAILTLLRNGLICLYDDPNNLYPIHPARARELMECEVWEMGNQDDDIYLALTDAGVKTFHKYSRLTRTHKHDFIGALRCGSRGTGYPQGVFERIAGVLWGRSDSIWRTRGRDVVSRSLDCAGVLLVALTKACVRTVDISKN